MALSFERSPLLELRFEMSGDADDFDDEIDDADEDFRSSSRCFRAMRSNSERATELLEREAQMKDPKEIQREIPGAAYVECERL